MFIDEIRIYARAGHGGKGCVAFQREKFRPKGGPSGGNGGRGGDVILEADHDLNNLIAQFYQPRLIAQDGQGGLGKGMDGHAGRDLVVKVPCGTLVWALERGADAPAESASSAEEKPALRTAASQRPMFRTAARVAAIEVDLGGEPEQGTSTGVEVRGELLADLRQRLVRCAGDEVLEHLRLVVEAKDGPLPTHKLNYESHNVDPSEHEHWSRPVPDHLFDFGEPTCVEPVTGAIKNVLDDSRIFRRLHGILGNVP